VLSLVMVATSTSNVVSVMVGSSDDQGAGDRVGAADAFGVDASEDLLHAVSDFGAGGRRPRSREFVVWINEMPEEYQTLAREHPLIRHRVRIYQRFRLGLK